MQCTSVISDYDIALSGVLMHFVSTKNLPFSIDDVNGEGR